MKWFEQTKTAIGLLVLTVVLAGCNDDAPSNTGADDNEKVTIVYARGVDVTPGNQKLIEAFEKAHPNINVKFQEMPAEPINMKDSLRTRLNSLPHNISVHCGME
jgi:multiple sugar transport system substrate-binding protein